MSKSWHSITERLRLSSSSQGSSTSSSSSEALPLYSAVAPGDALSLQPEQTSPVMQMIHDYPELSSHCAMTTAATEHTALRGLFRLPTLSSFLADFTLGFADGLTVPFALTAGLSSLGRTDTVIYAGMAEICAGSISMGIGGYLAARGEVAAAAAAASSAPDNSDAEAAALSSEDEKNMFGDVVASYLAPLDLPRDMYEMVERHARQSPAIPETLLAELSRRDGEEDKEDERLPSPIMSGLSVAIGYLLGGVLPLFPYILVEDVQHGLLWSFVVCVVALFVFGFSKDFALSSRSRTAGVDGGVKRGIPWKDIRRSTWEGAQMVILGSVAALAAVLCVRAFEGMSTEQPV